MKAVLFNHFKESPSITRVNDPEPGADEVVVEVKCSGLCLSDWHGWMGHDPDIKLPHVPGHELAGMIAALGKDVSSFKVGDRVTLPFVCGCGHCIYCREGNPQVCDHQFQPGFTHWGSFAEFVRIKYAEYNLVRIPENIDFQTAAILGCRFATSFRAIVDQGELQPGQWVAVHGCGGVGLSAIMIARAFGARVVAVDLDGTKLQMAEALGADYVINAQGDHIADQITDLTKGGVHLSLDAVGKPKIIHNSLASLRKGGRHLQVGLLDPQDHDISIAFDLLVSRELHLLGSHGMQALRYQEMIKLILEGKLNPGRLITRQVNLSQSIDELVNLSGKRDPGITVINNFSE
jgi:alcohol dehydrogenase